MPVTQQLRQILADNRVRVIDMFRDWDVDGNGLVEPAEFREAIATLGYAASRADVDALFAEMDRDGSGTLEFGEISRALRKKAEEKGPPRADAAAARGGPFSLSLIHI